MNASFPNFRPVTVEESVSALCDKVRSYKMHSDLTEAVVAVAEATKLSPLDGLEVIKQQTAALISSHQENDSETMAGLAPQLRAEYLAMKAGEVKLKGKPFPWDALNKATLGFQKQHVVVYYARPKHFKTWHALNTLRGLQAHGEPGVIFSQEMSAIEIARRWVALDAGVDYTSFLLGTLDEEAEARFFARLDEFVEKPNITIDTITSTGSAAVTEMSAKIGDYGARAVLLDGLYFLGEDWRELSEVTRGAKRISKAQDLYFLATTQQNRMKNQSGGDDVAYGDSALQDCDLLLKFSRDAMLRRQHKVAARVAAVRSGTEVAFEIHCVPCTNFSQGHVILDEDSDADPLDEKADGEDGTEGIPDAPGQE